jgi:hypothetical protein
MGLSAWFSALVACDALGWWSVPICLPAVIGGSAAVYAAAAADVRGDGDEAAALPSKEPPHA